MEPQTGNQMSEIKEKSPLHQVTPLSKYLALLLFIIMPFLGGWIGYSYSTTFPDVVVPEVKILRTPDLGFIDNNVISKNEFDPGTFSCRHTSLKEVFAYPSERSYDEWPVYTDVDFGVSFSYPSDQRPNFEERFKDENDREHLRVGYAPLYEIDENELPGKPILFDFDTSWQVELYRESNKSLVVNANYCSSHAWCLLEQVDYNSDFYTYVSTFEELSIGNPYLREYEIYSQDDVTIHISSAALTSLNWSPCHAVLSVTNLDKIAHSFNRLESN